VEVGLPRRFMDIGRIPYEEVSWENTKEVVVERASRLPFRRTWEGAGTFGVKGLGNPCA
jgi:hypothetical protein